MADNSDNIMILNIFLENPIMIDHNIGLNKMPVKRLSGSFLSFFFIQVQTVRKQQKKFCKLIILFLDLLNLHLFFSMCKQTLLTAYQTEKNY